MPWPEFLGTIPGWITAISSSGVLGVAAYFLLGRQKLTNADEADIRDHYAEELVALRKALETAGERHARRERLFLIRERHQETRHRELLQEGERRHQECVEAREQLRDQGRELKDIVAGLIGIIRQASASQAILLGDEASAFVLAAAERVHAMFKLPVLAAPREGGDNPG